MDEKGRGRLTISFDDDIGAKEGLYHYSTFDGGYHWFGPDYEPNKIRAAGAGYEDIFSYEEMIKVLE